MSSLTRLYRKSLVYWYKPRHWRLRPGTIDARLFFEVVVRNEYRLPPRFGAEDVILDVGGHIGCFAYAALQRGAGQVYCCEADAHNYELLKHNLHAYRARATARHVAVWRSDTAAARLYFTGPADRRNTGAGRMTGAVTDQEVPALPLDDLLRRVTEGGRRVRLLKLDCEGAEWPILLTSRRLSEVEAVCGEYHLHDLPAAYEVPGYPTFTPAVLQSYLREQGFEVRLAPAPRDPNLGLFFASRAACALPAA